MNPYSDRLDSATYADDQPVRFSVLTESRRDRFEVEMPENLFARAISLGRAYQLHVLSTLEVYAETSLHKAQCDSLLHELEFVLTITTDQLLSLHLLKVIEALRLVVQGQTPAGLLIEGP
jgi:hypothetical protein